MNVKLIEKLAVDFEHMYGPGVIELRPQMRGTITSGLSWICTWKPDKPLPVLITSGIGSKSREVPILLPGGSGKTPDAAIDDWTRQSVAMMKRIRGMT